MRSISSPFIHRPVGTTLLSLAIALAGIIAYFFLPVSPLPQVDFPSISVSAGLPGASPETMASSVATPLERQFGRIAGVAEMTSTSTLGQTSITLVFDLNRDINAAARDVQAAINAAGGQLPANMPNKPSYRKVNPADAPIMILAMTSDIYGKPTMYDAASTILAQKLSQVDGVGQVFVGGGALPAVRVEVNPMSLNALGLSLEDVRTALAAANANRPKGYISSNDKSFILTATDQLMHAKEYAKLIITYRNDAPVRLRDVAQVVDSVENITTNGIANGKPAVMLVIFRQPGANIIDTVDRVRELLPRFQASIPAGMNLAVANDRTITIRASVIDVEVTLAISVGLVIMVVFVFLRDIRATLIPSVAVPISLIGTLAVMYLLDYSIDNLSLMAMTIATGFVVDDAIVVIENIMRYLEKGLSPLQAALRGAGEIGFTVVSISISLIAVFIPILMMGGIVGRLFREFAVTLSIAIAVSLVVSLTTTPMMCALLLRNHRPDEHGRAYRISESIFNWVLNGYEHSLAFVLRHQFITLLVTIGTIALTIYLYMAVPKTLFPQQDTGRISGTIVADQNVSSQMMGRYMNQFSTIVLSDSAVDTAVSFSGGSRTSNQASMFVALKPLRERKISADEVIARLRKATAHVPGATLRFQAVQDLRTAGGRSSQSQYQYTLQADTFDELSEWAPLLLEKIKTLPGIVDANSDQQNGGLQATLVIDRATASRLGLSASDIDTLLYDSFGQRQVSTMYRQLNQYHVVMEVDPQFAQSPTALRSVYARTSDGGKIPLSAFSHIEMTSTPLGINHQGQFPSITLSFNLLPGFSLGKAVEEIKDAEHELGLPAAIRGNFAGTAQAFQDSLSTQPLLITAAILAVYIVLGMLYESLTHPITILSTIPSAGVGALLTLLLFRTELSVIAMIGIILLIGIVKKNAIIMIDFALDAERRERKSPRDAIFQAAILRFRPITMTTMAALLGGLPLALGTGVGSELRRPLGLSIVGGLIFSQMLTLYTTPVIYLYLDRLRLWLRRGKPELYPNRHEPVNPEVSPS